MKFNFKKIASVITSAVMIGGSFGMVAAANYPAPFVEGGAADAAIVYGSNLDLSAVVVMNNDLQYQLSTQTASSEDGSPATASGGDSYKIDKSTNRLNMDDNIYDIRSSKLTDDDLPTLLADGSYQAKDGQDASYTQTIGFYDVAAQSPKDKSNLNITHFQDSDYKDKEPALGFHLSSNYIFNYTLDFTKDPKSDVNTNDRLEDLENTKITILGKEYTLLNAYNGTTDDKKKFELMGGAVSDRILQDESKTYTVDGKTYEVSVDWVDASDTKLTVNGETTTSLSEGSTYKLSDDTQVGIRDIMYTSKSAIDNRVEFSLGAQKVTIENNEYLEINDEDVKSIHSYITAGTSGSKQTIQKIVLRWKQYDETFITPEQSLTMPGLEAVEFKMGAFTFPAEEVIEVTNAGSDVVELKIPITDGTATIPLLYGNETSWQATGGDDDEFLITSQNGTIFYNASSSVSSYQNNGTQNVAGIPAQGGAAYFVASWNDSKDSESYFLTTSTAEDTDDGKNYTDITNKITGDKVCEKKKVGEICTIGNVEITVERVDPTLDDHEFTVLTINTNEGSFDKVFSDEGLTVYLPIANCTGSHDLNTSGMNFTGETRSHVSACYNFLNDSTTAYPLHADEEDKDATLGSGKAFNISLDHSSDKVYVNDIELEDGASRDSTDHFLEVGDTDVYEAYMASDLATKFLWDKTSGSQYDVTLTYHGSQSYANLFLAEPSVTISGGGIGGGTTGSVAQLGEVSVMDSEVSSVSSKNLLVVGGSCVNSVAQNLLGLSGAACGDSWTTATGAGSGEFIVETFESPYTTGKVATLVAGWETADTKNAVVWVKTNKPLIEADKKYKSTTATSAELVTE